MLKKVGLIGESEYDRDALRNLLSRYYGQKVQFVHFLKRAPGTQLDQNKTLRILSDELARREIDALIVQRDLDSHEADSVKKEKRNNFFDQIKSQTSAASFFLLHVHTLEALILADMDGFNKRFKTAVEYKGDPMSQEKPKEWLQAKCKRDGYLPKHSPELFLLLDIEKLKRVRYFKKFINEFEHYLNNKAA